MKKNEEAKEINLLFFKRKKMKKKISTLFSKMIDMKLYTLKHSSKKLEKVETKNNNTFMKVNKKILKVKSENSYTRRKSFFSYKK